MPSTATRPAQSEHNPYYSKYIDLVEGEDVLSALKSQLRETIAFLNCVSNEESVSRYAPGKWSVREVVGHVIDTERIFAYRALRIARGDTTPLPGFEQDDYIAAAQFDGRPWDLLLEEFAAVRRANLLMFPGLTRQAGHHRGVVNNNPIPARALAYIIAGHELHHVAV